MNIINRESVTNEMLWDMEMYLACTNEEVREFCRNQNWDIYYFIEQLDGRS